MICRHARTTVARNVTVPLVRKPGGQSYLHSKKGVVQQVAYIEYCSNRTCEHVFRVQW